MRNRTNKMWEGVCVCVCVCVCVYIDNKELAHTIMESEKSQDLQATSWRPRRADDMVPV